MSVLARLNRRERGLLIAAFVLLISGAYYFYLYQPLQAEEENLKEELEELEEAQELARERIRSIPELERELEAKLEEKEKFLEHPIDEPEQILTDLVAAVEGVELVATAYQPRLDEDGFSLQFELEGSYYSMLQLIKILEDLDPRLEVLAFDINYRSDELEMELELFYHLVEEEEG